MVLYVGNSSVTAEFPSQRPVTRSFDISFDLRLNKPVWVNNRETGDLRRHRAHYDITVVQPQSGRLDEILSLLMWSTDCFAYILQSYLRIFFFHKILGKEYCWLILFATRNIGNAIHFYVHWTQFNDFVNISVIYVTKNVTFKAKHLRE